jgi:hypothetical protein
MYILYFERLGRGGSNNNNNMIVSIHYGHDAYYNNCFYDRKKGQHVPMKYALTNF